MSTIAILDCFSGISGDMTIGAFCDLGMDPAFLKKELAKLPLRGYSLAIEKVKRGHIGGTQFHVRCTEKKDAAHRRAHHGHHHAVTYREITTLIQKSSSAPAVRDLSLRIFAKLAKAESHVHRVPLNRVAFHEVGAIDSIVDVVSAALCFTYFKVTDVYVQNLSFGTGTVPMSSHGLLPVPAPATIELLRGFPATFTSVPYELVTPTGAAIIAALAVPAGTVPPFAVECVGYGAGTREIPGRPNFLRVILARENLCSPRRQTIRLLETNIDDLAPVHYEELFDALLSAGALDVYITPILMKKSRPAQMISVLFEHDREEKIVDRVFTYTSTLGVRMQTLDRIVLSRSAQTVKTRFGAVRAKAYCLRDGLRRVMPEYESCKQIARANNVPVKQVYDAVLSHTMNA